MRETITTDWPLYDRHGRWIDTVEALITVDYRLADALDIDCGVEFWLTDMRLFLPGCQLWITSTDAEHAALQRAVEVSDEVGDIMYAVRKIQARYLEEDNYDPDDEEARHYVALSVAERRAA